MRLLLDAPDGHELESALAALGHDVRRDEPPIGFDALVTVEPVPELELLAELEPEVWSQRLRTWVEEPFWLAQEWLRDVLERGADGQWVAVTTNLGTQPFPGAGASGACAHALHTLVRVVALEYGPQGVRANAVAPGWEVGRLPAALDEALAVADTPSGRFSTARDVAGTVDWLLSPAAGNLTGEVLRVDGGYTIGRGTRLEPWVEAGPWK